MLRLSLRLLRYRKTGIAATFLALFFGSAIVMACGGLLETGVRLSIPPQRLSGVPIVVTGNQSYDGESLTERRRLDPAVLDRVRTTPGVAEAVPDLSVPAAVLVGGKVVGNGPAYGRDWSAAALTPYTLAAGTPPVDPGDVVLDARLAAAAGVRTGDDVDAVARGQTLRVHVTGVTAPNSVPSPALFFSDAETARLTDDGGQLDAIGVRPAPGADTATVAAAVRQAVGAEGSVFTGDERGRAEFPAAAGGGKTLTILASIFGSWAVLIALFGVTSMLGLSLQQRQLEIAQLRAIGATPGQVRRMILIETLVLSVVATALAVAPAYLLGRMLLDQLTGSGVVSAAIAFHQGVIPAVAGAVIAAVAALGATVVAARRSVRTKPTAALSEAVVERHWLTRPRLLLALLFLAAGTSMSVVTVTVMSDGPTLASTAGPASVLVGVGFALLAPGIVAALARVLQRPVRAVTASPGFLAVRNAKVRNIRMAGAVAPIVLLVGIAAGTLYMQSTENAVKTGTYAKSMLADFVLDSGTGGFTPDVVTRVRALPGVRAASELVTTSGFVDGHGSDFTFRGVSAAGAAQTVFFPQVAGSLADLHGEAVAISAKQASSFGVGIGDTLPIHLGDGTAIRANIVAVHADIPNDDALFLPADLLARHTTAGLATQILVRAADARESDQLRHDLDGFAATVPGATVSDREGLISNNSRVQQILVSANYTIVAMIVGYAAITVVNSLVSATRTRRREFALQRLTGFRPGQVLRMLGVESALVCLIAIALGTVAAAATAVPYSWVKSGSVIPSGTFGIYLAIVAGAVVLTLGATLLPAAQGMRRPPIETVGAPE